MRSRAAASATLLVSLALAGCFEDEPVAAQAAPEPDVVLVTAENNIESLTNESFNMAAHQHDYWEGKERLSIIDLSRPDGTFWFGGDWAFKFVPEDGIVVPQGTQRVEITFDWAGEDPELYTSPEVWIKTAADFEPAFLGEAVKREMLTMEPTLAQVDLPHQTISGWRFELRFSPAVDGARGILWQGEITAKIEAIRGAEIPIYPAHPDLWGGAETIELFADRRGPALWWGDVDEWGCFMACPIKHKAVNGTVVPFDAAAVEVVLEQEDDSPVGIGLQYHGTNTWAWQDLEPVAVEGRTQRFLIPVEPGMGDSPYASQSVWEFAIHVSSPERDSVMIGTYTMTSRALKIMP